MTRTTRTARTFVLIFLGLLLLSLGSMAQERGQYLPGTNGLNSGVQPAPGFTYMNMFTWFHADRLKGPDGSAIPVKSDANLYVDQNLFFYVTKWKVLGANVGFMVDMPILNSAIQGPLLTALGKNVGGAGVSDLYIQPVNLGWHLKHADLQASYGFFAPTGRYNPGATNNVGSGYWGHDLQFAGTFYFDKMKMWQLSAYNNYEIHQSKQTTLGSVTPGQTYNLEWGFAHTFKLKPNFSQLLQVGVVGYNQWQTSNDTGLTLFPNAHYQVHAIGPEITFVMPMKKLSATFRYLPEWGAVKRSEGHTMVVAFSYRF
ncbi:MAG TPA: transporter [Terriglobales bacterium]|jgi:hypothetical protein|nr:transporter [Terriglobales bacterium]